MCVTIYLALVALSLGSERAIAASSTSECASLVLEEDRRRGKGAFYSGCTDRSPTSGRGGCWSSLINEHSGCQTCIVQDSGGSNSLDWGTSVFAEMFENELDSCPDEVAELYTATMDSMITLESVQSSGCGDWLSYQDSCYFKSSYLDLATTWVDAETRCGVMGARLVSVESEGENDFVLYNLLWPGFLGEAYYGLRKGTGGGKWEWSDTLSGFSPQTFDASTSFQDWADGLDATSFYLEDGPSCLEMTPYSPKAWNPFSCEVNKHYVCEKPITGETSATLAPETGRTPSPSVASSSLPPTTSSVLEPTPSPTSAKVIPPTTSPVSSQILSPASTPAPSSPAEPTGAPLVIPVSPSPEISTATPSLSPTAVRPQLLSSTSPTAAPEGARDCVKLLSDSDKSYLAMYDKDVYVEALCVSSTIGAPVWCNAFGIGQECRSCWLSCEGARLFVEEFPLFDRDTVNFCPWIEFEDYDVDCGEGVGERRLLNKRMLLRGS